MCHNHRRVNLRLNCLPGVLSWDLGLSKYIWLLSCKFFEWNLFGMTASDNVCQCSLYILPIPSVDKLFIRYMEKGVYKGFTQKFLPVLLEKYNIPPQNAYMWNLYTDQDLSHENSLNKYEDRSTKGFYQMMYKNTNSAGNLLGRVKHQLDPLHSLVYAQKKNTRPNVATDK